MQAASVEGLVIDLADARVVRGVLAGVPLEAAALQQVVDALARKDAAALQVLARDFPEASREALLRLPTLYGDAEVLAEARRVLPQRALIGEALDDLQWLARHLQRDHAGVRIGFDLSDMSGYAYYSGPRFAVYAAASSDALARGGRYDEVGAIFGRNRPAVGFSLDLKTLAEAAGGTPAPTAIRAPWGEEPELRAAVRRLREAGETVLAVLPGHEPEVSAFDCDRELVAVAGRWVLRSIAAVPATNS